MVVGILPILMEYIIRRTHLKQLEWLMACRVMVLTEGDILGSAAIDDMDAIDDVDAILVTDADPITDGDITNGS